MRSHTDGTVIIQVLSESVPSTPSWFGEAVLLIAHLKKQGVFANLCERVRFARRRFGRYEVLDFLAVLFGYEISGERTLEAFYEALNLFASPFMALFGRSQMPSRSALSRFLAALTQPVIEALRTLFLEDELARPLCPDEQEAGLLDRQNQHWIVFDVDGTREAARQRALPQSDDLPEPTRRLDEVCAPGYTGRKRGEIVLTRTTVSQAHSFQWLGSFGNRGNEPYREKLRRATGAIDSYLAVRHLSRERALVCLDGQYGTGAVLADLAGFSFVTPGKDYAVLKRPEIQTRLHRGAFEPTLADEDDELDPDRWCSYSACGQEAWNIIAQWVWNLRLELGYQIKPEPLRTTEFAPALDKHQAERASAQGYEPPVIGGSWKAGCYSGEDFSQACSSFASVSTCSAQFCVRLSRTTGCLDLVARLVGATNPAIRLYKRMGFVVKGEIANRVGTRSLNMVIQLS